MEDGASKGIFLGIALIIVAAILGVALAIFSISRNTANDGVVNVQGALGSMNESIYNDYDQKVVVGSQIMSAYNSFNGKTIAIVVKTCKGSWINYNACISPFSKATSFKETAVPFKGFSLDAISKQYTFSDSYIDSTSAGINPTFVLDGSTAEKQTVVYNNSTAALSKSGDVNYVSSTSKFNSYLIRDASDDVIGIAFVQQGKHV